MPKRLPYSRADRIATEIHHVVAQALYDTVSDPRVSGVLITHVKVSKDLRLARINYFLRGTASARVECQLGLEQAVGKLKQTIGEQLVMRYMPELVFHFDESIEHAERIEDLLEKIRDQEKTP